VSNTNSNNNDKEFYNELSAMKQEIDELKQIIEKQENRIKYLESKF
jgi:hypothetical protein